MGDRSRRGRRHGRGPPFHDDPKQQQEEDEHDEKELGLLLSTFDRCRARADGTVDARSVCARVLPPALPIRPRPL